MKQQILWVVETKDKYGKWVLWWVSSKGRQMAREEARMYRGWGDAARVVKYIRSE